MSELSRSVKVLTERANADARTPLLNTDTIFLEPMRSPNCAKSERDGSKEESVLLIGPDRDSYAYLRIQGSRGTARSEQACFRSKRGELEIREWLNRQNFQRIRETARQPPR